MISGWLPIGLLLVVAGAIGTGIGLAASPADTWPALLAAWLFGLGFAQGALAWTAIFATVDARWPGPVRRLGLAFVGFLPVALLLLPGFWFGRDHLFLWLDHHLGGREVWLNLPFLFSRDIVALALLTAADLAFVRRHLAADHDLRARRRLVTGAVALLVMFVFVLSLLGIDLAMSLDGEWFSALFPAYLFISSLYLGIAALIPLSAAVRKRLPERLGPKVFGDLGNLLLALELMTAWFFFSQLLVIWYSNIPHDARYLATRINQGPWLAYSRFLIAGVYLGPLPFLVFKEVKQRAAPLVLVALAVLGGLAIERFMLVVPTLRPEGPGFGWPAAAAFTLMIGLLIVSASWFCGRYPLDIEWPAQEGPDES